MEGVHHGLKLEVLWRCLTETETVAGLRQCEPWVRVIGLIHQCWVGEGREGKQ